MDFENSDDDSVKIEFDFSGDAAPTSTDPYRDDVISDRQQSILNDLRINICHEDLIYLNNHKEVEAIASLLAIDILKKSPKNPHTHAACYLRKPQITDLVANFKRSEDFQYEKMLKNDRQQYATMALALTLAASGQVTSAVNVDKQTEVSEDGKTDVMKDQYDLLAGEDTYVMTEEEIKTTVSQNQ